MRIADGLAVLDRALALRRPGPYTIQAAIAALHARARAFSETDWPQIAALYAELERLDPSPVVTVNRAVAVSFADDPAAGLEILDAVAADPRLERYLPLHAARAELLARAGDGAAADDAYARAIELSENAAERSALERRRRSQRPSS
jgi:RNA polymerase sigma-70 factor (ECF subfamily)